MSLQVWDWRRRTFAVRAEDDPAAAHARWVDGRNAMLTGHPASPVPVDLRDRYPGADVAAYDPAYRFVVPVDTAGELPLARRVKASLMQSSSTNSGVTE